MNRRFRRSNGAAEDGVPSVANAKAIDPNVVQT
jgi:hypothetical protein